VIAKKIGAIASDAWQSMSSWVMDCRVAALLAMTMLFASLRAKRGSPCSWNSWIASIAHRHDEGCIKVS
jgi:hypothetical protein